MDWRPTASWATLQQRAQVLSQIRTFFAQRGVCEVDTPLMGHTTCPNRYIDPLSVQGLADTTYYLHTSPEFAMKRLLAAGFGDIYQICKVFRADPCSIRHNPEFTMSEWYRRDWDHLQLMHEVDHLLQSLGFPAAAYITYAQAFQNILSIDPFAAKIEDLAGACQSNLPAFSQNWSRDTWLDYCFGCIIEPALGHAAPLFVTQFPAEQAALARVLPDKKTCARFEVYIQGIEIANGYHELGDPEILEARFIEENALRAQDGRRPLPLDRRFLDAHIEGLPQCSGVALGVDRLMMCALQKNNIAEVLSFITENS